jgi:hypothetical protein
MRRAHDDHRDLPTLDAAARAAGLSRTNRNGDAVTRHGSCQRCVVAMWHQPSTHRGPGGWLTSLSMLIPDAISDFAHPWPRISAPLARKNFCHVDSGERGHRCNRRHQHNQILKSP